jgi:peptide/nickel transport system ATP-binding protein
MTSRQLLEVEDLHLAFTTHDGVVEALRGVSLGIEAGRTVGIVGESGSGKSVLAQSIVGLTPADRVSGKVIFDGTDLLRTGQNELRHVRGARIGMVFQDPLSSLHPLYRVGWQITELIRAHDRKMSKAAARGRAVELLRLVGIAEPERRVNAYPHQLSGGMRQRVMIGMAMALSPALLIADEPTTALDVTVQAQVLELMDGLREQFGTAIMMITHDLGVVAQMADEVIVMYAGLIMERATRHQAFSSFHHPYTEGLLASLPGVDGGRLRPIAGQPPRMINPPPGCPFAPRCRYVMDACRERLPELRPIPGEPGHVSACLLPKQPASREALRVSAGGGEL